MEVENTIEINAPKAATFAFILDFNNNPGWQSGMRDTRMITEGPVAVGTQYSQLAEFMGRETTAIFEVEDLQPDSLIKVKALEAPLPITITRSVAGEGDTSTVTTKIEATLTGMLKMAAPMIKNIIRDTIEKDHEALKQRLEATTV